MKSKKEQPSNNLIAMGVIFLFLITLTAGLSIGVLVMAIKALL